MVRLYNCDKCPAYCCSYGRIVVTKPDIRRLARHFSIMPDDAEARFTKKGRTPKERILRHQADEHFITICRFLDTNTRTCTVYDARPGICREFPGQGRCGYYDFLSFERRTQDDPDWIATTD